MFTIKITNKLVVLTAVFIIYAMQSVYCQQGWIGHETHPPSNYDMYFAGPDTCYVVGNITFGPAPYHHRSHITRTTNSGVDWDTVIFVDNYQFYSICLACNNAFTIGNSENYIYRSTNRGRNWVPYNIGIWQSSKKIYFTDCLTGYVCGSWSNIIKTTNAGLNWELIPIENGIGNNYDFSFTSPDTGYLVGADPYHILKTTNAGLNWNLLLSGSGYLWAVHFPNSQTGYAGGSDLLLKTANAGGNWQEITFSNDFRIFAVYFLNQDTGFVGGKSGLNVTLLYKTINGGANWSLQNLYILSGAVRKIIFLNNLTGYALTDVNLYSTTTGGDPLNVKQINGNSPSHYKLFPCYPNPFNPVTHIKFQITSAGNAEIKVFDVRGIEITSLINQKLGAGTYKVDFNATNLSSGVYFYRLTVRSADKKEIFIDTKKMVLIK